MTIPLPPPTPPPPASEPAGWFADPAGRHQYRYWNGKGWTDDVADAGQSGRDPFGDPTPPRPVNVSGPDRVQQQVQRAHVAQVAGGGGSLFTEPVLVVNQKAKLIELTNEYAVYDQNGHQLGSVVEVGQSTAKKMLRFVSNVDQFLTHKVEVRDASGTPQLVLTRPAKVFKSKFQVTTPDGGQIGQVVQENVFGKIRFGLQAPDGRPVGAIRAENWRAWNFSIVDDTETEVARITKTWEGLAKAAFTTADNYVLQIYRPLDEPLRSLVICSALTVDTALKQDD